MRIQHGAVGSRGKLAAAHPVRERVRGADGVLDDGAVRAAVAEAGDDVVALHELAHVLHAIPAVGQRTRYGAGCAGQGGWV